MLNYGNSNPGLSAADVAAVMNGNNNGWGFGNDGGWWLLVLLFALGGGGWGNFGFGGMNGFNAGMMGAGFADNIMLWPYLMSQNLGNQMQNGFDYSGTNSRIDNLSNQMQNGFNEIQTNGRLDAIQNSINAMASDNCNRSYQQTIDQMQNNFNAERALDNRLDSMEMAQQKCCCDMQLQNESLRATILAENCEDRNQALLNTRDIIENQTASTQKILDKMCQMELDTVKQNYEGQIRDLQNQLAGAALANQNARFDASQLRQTQDIENFVRPPINPSYPVPNPYGFSWNPYYGYGSGGCGCGGYYQQQGGFFG